LKYLLYQQMVSKGKFYIVGCGNESGSKRNTKGISKKCCCALDGRVGESSAATANTKLPAQEDIRLT
jgi:hypothetical protein